MDFEIYCDESRPEVFTTPAAPRRAPYLLIGGLWLPAALRPELKRRIQELKAKHRCHGELKWAKVSPARFPFYAEVVDLFEG